jgi:hypothetical protein
VPETVSNTYSSREPRTNRKSFARYACFVCSAHGRSRGLKREYEYSSPLLFNIDQGNFSKKSIIALCNSNLIRLDVPTQASGTEPLPNLDKSSLQPFSHTRGQRWSKSYVES